MDEKQAARLLNRYAHGYSAGAFATPTAKDMTEIMRRGGWHDWGKVFATSVRLERESRRTDWTGRKYAIPEHSRIITHIGRTEDCTSRDVPDLGGFSRVYAYAEDPVLTGAMLAQGRQVSAVRISAASEIINCWGHLMSGWTYADWDRATLVELPVELHRDLLAGAGHEVRQLEGWYDDYPFYSDGSWGALSLRGFNPADPQWGIKPSEMSKAWWKKHPEAAKYQSCQWTVLAERWPALTTLAGQWAKLGELERVRVLRMAGQGNPGTLSRHTDITDRAAGTRDGQIVRVHIPILTGRAAVMTAWNLRGERTTLHLPYGTAWYLDARKPHAVVNATGFDRIHLVVDIKATQACRDLITAGKDMAA